MGYIIGQAGVDVEDYAMAKRKAQHFMKALFGGSMPVRCACGEAVKYKHNKLVCASCGMRLNRVAYEDDYDDKLLKTVIDVDKKEFVLERKDFDSEF